MQHASLSFKMACCGQLLEWRARTHISSQMTTLRSGLCGVVTHGRHAGPLVTRGWHELSRHRLNATVLLCKKGD
jgi:hypothetical protein